MKAGRFESLTVESLVEFPEYQTPEPEPMDLVQRWLAEAERRGVREPRALALATADARGRPSTRVVAITAITSQGLVFTTHSTSQKGRELAENPWASGVFYWRETGQQIILSGPVARLSDAEADGLWQARPIPLHAMSTASHQSDPLPDPARLLAQAERLEALGTALTRPDRFAGYRLEPTAVEFWCACPDRLHFRLRYDRKGSGWHTSRLQP